MKPSEFTVTYCYIFIYSFLSFQNNKGRKGNRRFLVELSNLVVALNYQPRTQVLSSMQRCGGKTLVGAGHVIDRILIAQGGVGGY